jgi:hypothetical protein
MRTERVITIRSSTEAVGSFRPLLMRQMKTVPHRRRRLSNPRLTGRRIAMDPRYRTSLTSCLIVHSMAAGLAICAAIAPCEAADRTIGLVESGQPRDLVNRPVCWAIEYSEEWYRCAAGLR